MTVVVTHRALLRESKEAGEYTVERRSSNLLMDPQCQSKLGAIGRFERRPARSLSRGHGIRPEFFLSLCRGRLLGHVSQQR